MPSELDEARSSVSVLALSSWRASVDERSPHLIIVKEVQRDGYLVRFVCPLPCGRLPRCSLCPETSAIYWQSSFPFGDSGAASKIRVMI
jgi:hypothetical protein